MIVRLLFLFALYLLPCAVCGQISREYFFIKATNELIDRRYSSAIESFNLLLKIDTAMYDAYFRRAIAKYNLGDAIGALSDFNRAISLNPVFTYAYFYRAMVRNSMGNHLDALKDLDEVESLRPQFSEIYYSRGISYFYLQQFQQALDNYNLYLRYNASSNSGYLMRGACLLFLKDTAAAMRDYDKAISINTLDPDGYSRRGRLYAMLGQDSSAIADFNYAIRLDSSASLNYYFRALSLYNLHKIEPALMDLDRVLLLDPYNALVRYNRAIMFAQIGRYDDALKDYNEAALINPRNVLIYYNRAALHLEQGRERSAIADYTSAIELYPNFANAYLNRSYAKRKLGDLFSAKQDYDMAQKILNDHQSRAQDGSDSLQYADTSGQYDKLVAFDADFGNKDFDENLLQYQRTDISMQPLYRICVGVQQEGTPHDYNKAYYHQAWEQWRQENAWVQISIRAGMPERSPEQRKRLEERADLFIDSAAYRSGIGYFVKAALLSEQNMYNAAINFYVQAISIEEQNPFYYIAQSSAQSDMIDFIANIEQQQTSPIIVENSPLGYNASSISMQGKASAAAVQAPSYDYQQAILLLDRAIELLPSFAYAYYNRGNLKCSSNQLPEALEDYTAAIERYAYFADAYYNRGLVQIYLHDTNKGCMDLSKAGELGIKQAYNVIKRYCK